MDDEAREHAIRILLDEQAKDEDRITSARSLGNSSDIKTFDALLDVCREPEGSTELFQAAGESLALVTARLGHESKVEHANLNHTARQAYVTEAR